MSRYLGTYLAVLLPATVFAQNATSMMKEAVCDVPSVYWTFNSVGKSPCQVATDLAGVCNNGFYMIASLPSKTHYVGPGTQNDCQCNTVFYSLLSACAACQGAKWLTWPRFSKNCTEVYTSMFPRPIPADEKVPGWAYANVALTSNNFSLAFAQGLSHMPEFTAASSAILTTSTTVSSVSTPSISASSAESQPDSRAGAIAGSVVGGIVGLVTIACLSLYLFLHYRGRGQKSSAFTRLPANDKLYEPLPDSRTYPLPVPGSYVDLYSPGPESTGMHSPPGTTIESSHHYVV